MQEQVLVLLYYNNEVWCPLKFTRVCIFFIYFVIDTFVIKTFKMYSCMNIRIYFVIKTFKMYSCISILMKFVDELTGKCMAYFIVNRPFVGARRLGILKI